MSYLLNKWPFRKPFYGTKDTYYLTVPWLTYEGEFLADWGSGQNPFAESLVPNPLQYVGIDGTLGENKKNGVFQADLAKVNYTSDSILMRHVLENNENWPEILENALKSFKKKMCLVLFMEPWWHSNPHDSVRTTGETVDGFELVYYAINGPKLVNLIEANVDEYTDMMFEPQPFSGKDRPERIYYLRKK